MFLKITRKHIHKYLKYFSTVATPLLPNPKYVSDTRNVTLRGIKLDGLFNDLPNLIFFSEAIDPVTNWTNFFENPDNRFLEYRNIWLVNPRNFGNSDRHPSFDLSEMADDVIRFMYENQITMATLGGHGFGGKLALAVGCYHAERVTGQTLLLHYSVFCIDSTPMDHRYFEPFQELKAYLNKLVGIDMNRSKSDIEGELKQSIPDPKWRSIFIQNVKSINDTRHEWNFELNYLHRNVSFNKADSIGYWAQKHGLYTGRPFFIFPDQSRWVHIATNTLPILKVCSKARGWGVDIIGIQGDDNPLNHWMYDFDHYSFPLSRKLLQFLRLKDGVHGLLHDRTEIGNYFIPDRINSRKNADHVYGDYTPAHLHHNWRFSKIYEEAKHYETDPDYDDPTKKEQAWSQTKQDK